MVELCVLRYPILPFPHKSSRFIRHSYTPANSESHKNHNDLAHRET